MGRTDLLKNNKTLNYASNWEDDSLHLYGYIHEDEFCDEPEDDDNIYSNNVSKDDFHLVRPTLINKTDDMFINVVGHDREKKEISLVIEWFKDSQKLKSSGLTIPKGMLLHGAPGNGKSLIIKEIIRCSTVPVLIFQGTLNNYEASLSRTFAEARKLGKAIIVIDELDSLIIKCKGIKRILQQNLDGVETANDDILVIAAANDIDEIYGPLTRSGRFDKLIKIRRPTKDDALALFKKYVNKLNLTLSEDFDEDEAASLLRGIPFSNISSVINDIILRNGFLTITRDMFVYSIHITQKHQFLEEQKPTKTICIHEAGHAIMANNFKEYFIIKCMNINNYGGEFAYDDEDEDSTIYDKVIAQIKIAMAGVIAEKILLKTGSCGCSEDLQFARSSAYRLINILGYDGCAKTLPPIHGGREETQTKRRNNEKIIEKLLRKCERETTRFIKKHKNDITTLANLLFTNKHLNAKEILSVLH